LKIIGFYDDVRVHYLDEAEYRPFDLNGLSFRNINTPEELQQAHQPRD
jgi:molybdopterin-guanine dinucleotide biosynthesis protein A